MTLQLTHYNPSAWFHTLAQSRSEHDWTIRFKQFHLEQMDAHTKQTMLKCAMKKGYLDWCVNMVNQGVFEIPTIPNYSDLAGKDLNEIHAWLTSPWWVRDASIHDGRYDLDLIFQIPDNSEITIECMDTCIQKIHQLWDAYGIRTAYDIWKWCHVENRMIPTDVYRPFSNPEWYTITDHGISETCKRILWYAILSHPEGDLAYWMITQGNPDRSRILVHISANAEHVLHELHNMSALAQYMELPPYGLSIVESSRVRKSSPIWIKFQSLAPLWDISLEKRTPIVEIESHIVQLYAAQHEIEPLDIQENVGYA